MKQVISTEKYPIKLWLNKIEDGAMTQLKNLANLPFIHKWICAMPDCHQGYGMPIGGVMATKNVVIPNAVGVDIGCGICAVKTSLTEIDRDTLKKIMGEIRKVIPVGFKHHEKKQELSLMPLCNDLTNDTHITTPTIESMKIILEQFNNALTQLGTLGGGNHFIEIQKGSDKHIWIMIHSGSRNLGYKVAKHYNEIAKKLNENWFSSIPKEHELAFLPINTKECQDYLKEMNYCVDFALTNRKLMMEKILKIISNLCYRHCDLCSAQGHKGKVPTKPNGECMNGTKFKFSSEPMINIAHNYVACENHFGQNVWVHRKGATLARKGTIGIIPGSQGTKSYIVEGLGNPDSFMSCSHGAGRTMGRKQAIRELDLEEQQNKMKGILHSVRRKKQLDEAPDAYKDIQEVMNNQKDLVKILVELSPLAVIKG